MNDSLSIYELTIMGYLEKRWFNWFEDLSVSQSPDGKTVIRGKMDQAALRGVINRIGDLGLVLVSVQCLSKND